MRINADLERPASADGNALPWVPSPMAGVERRMFDRIGDEVARATSLVRYAPDSHFPRHTHGGGEEFLVLDGVFSDEHGDYPAGTYVRNPVGTSHSPFTRPGCTILVKLHQMPADDRRQCVVDTGAAPGEALADGATRTALHATAAERVDLLTLDAGATAALEAGRGLELLVLDGVLHIDGLGDSVPQRDVWGAGCGAGWWLRLPGAQALALAAGQEGARVFLKRDHLAA